MKIISLIRFKIAWLRWLLTPAYRYGDPALGSGEARRQKRNILKAHHAALEPKRADFNLEPEDHP